MRKSLNPLLALILALSALLAGCATKNYSDKSVIERELGLHYTRGSMEGNDIALRTVDTTTVFGNLGLRLGSFVTFLGLNYQFANQVTEPSEVNYQNTSGNGYLVNLGIKYKLPSLALSVGYIVYGSYTLAKKTTGDLESVYTTPIGFFTKLDFNLSPRTALFLIFSQLEYGMHFYNNADAEGKLSHTSYGLGLSYKL